MKSTFYQEQRDQVGRDNVFATKHVLRNVHKCYAIPGRNF